MGLCHVIFPLQSFSGPASTSSFQLLLSAIAPALPWAIQGFLSILFLYRHCHTLSASNWPLHTHGCMLQAKDSSLMGRIGLCLQKFPRNKQIFLGTWLNYLGLYLAYSSCTKMGDSSIAINIILEGEKKPWNSLICSLWTWNSVDFSAWGLWLFVVSYPGVQKNNLNTGISILTISAGNSSVGGLAHLGEILSHNFQLFPTINIFLHPSRRPDQFSWSLILIISVPPSRAPFLSLHCTMATLTPLKPHQNHLEALPSTLPDPALSSLQWTLGTVAAVAPEAFFTNHI